MLGRILAAAALLGSLGSCSNTSIAAAPAASLAVPITTVVSAGKSDDGNVTIGYVPDTTNADKSKGFQVRSSHHVEGNTIRLTATVVYTTDPSTTEVTQYIVVAKLPAGTYTLVDGFNGRSHGTYEAGTGTFTR